MYISPIEIKPSDYLATMEKNVVKVVQHYGIAVERDELIRALRYDREQYDRGYEDGIANVPRWIPCEEALPKENGHYLVTFHQTATEEDLGFDMDDTDVRKMRYDTKHGWRTPIHIPSWINDAVVSTVLAWMPLPKPFEGGIK